MTHLELHLRVMGVIMLLLVAMNLHIPRRFRWKQEMAGLSLVNRQIFQVHAAFICIILALFATMLLGLTNELLQPTRLARGILVGMATFWFCRMCRSASSGIVISRGPTGRSRSIRSSVGIRFSGRK